ncbi:MAG: TlpA disulfide reductase family protein [Ginsengibacter sp.]
MSKDRDLMQMNVVGIEYKEGSLADDQIVLSSIDPNRNKKVMNTSLMLNYFYLLENPVLFEVEGGIIYLDSLKLSKDIYTKVELWDIKKDSKLFVLKGIYQEIEELAQKLFVPLPKEVLSGKMDSWEDASGFSQKVTRRDKGILTLNSADDKGLYKSSLVINKNRRILGQELRHEVEFSFNDGPKSKGFFRNEIYTVASFKYNKIDTSYLNMLVFGSSFSDACYAGNSFDSARFFNYIHRYEPKYSGDKSFVFTKLNGLQLLNNYPLYQKEIGKIPTKLLAGTHHLSNKMNVPNLSLDEYLEIISFFNKEELYSHLQHNFSQLFLDNREDPLDKLAVLSTHESELIRNAALPMFYWVSAKSNIGVIDSLKFYAQKLIQSNDEVWNSGNSGRYALLVYKMFKENIAPEDASGYLSQITERLKSLYEDSKNDKRRVQQAHLAYAYYLNYKASNQSDSELAGQMLEKAAFFSPKAEGPDYSSFYDRLFLKSKENYQEDYLTLLAATGKTDQALKDYIEEFLKSQDKTFNGIKSFYVKNYGAENFGTFFKDDVLSKLENAPAFDLLNLKAKNYSLKEKKGKWIIIDFWGTWCGPCVAEMPDINKFYNEIKNDPDSNIEFVSIACLDKQEKVESFLEKNKYNIPVLMSDSKVEQDYKVRAYPTKFIISPEGKLLRINFGFDWKGLVKELASL